jgi:PEP-CTERM motif-containing protein
VTVVPAAKPGHNRSQIEILARMSLAATKERPLMNHNAPSKSSRPLTFALLLAAPLVAMANSQVVNGSFESDSQAANAWSIQQHDNAVGSVDFAGRGTAHISDASQAFATSPGRHDLRFAYEPSKGNSSLSNGSEAFERTDDSFGRSLDVASLTAVVPEPGTYALMLAGLGVVVAFIARRRAAD